MKTDNGDEVLVMLALPLDGQLAADLLGAIKGVADKHGYTDAAILTDGTNRVVAKPPRRGE